MNKKKKGENQEKIKINHHGKVIAEIIILKITA